MQDALLLRDVYGKILGKIDNYWLQNDDEFWKDEKCYDVRFPENKEKMHGEVIHRRIEDIK